MIYILLLHATLSAIYNIHNIHFDPKFMSWNLCQWQLVMETPIGSNRNGLKPDAKIVTLKKILNL